MSDPVQPLRRQGSDIVLYFVASGLAQIGFFAGRYLMASIVHPATFGRFDAVLSLGSLLGIVAALGLHGAVTHYVAFHHAQPDEQQTYFSSALALQLVISGLFASGLLVVVAALGTGGTLIGLDRGEWTSAGIIALASSAWLLPAAALLSRRERRPLIVANLARLACLGILIVGLSLSRGLRTVSAISVGWALGGLIQAAVVFLAIRSLVRLRKSRRQAAMDSFRFGAAAFLHSAAGWLLIAADRLVLIANVESSELGRYSLAYLLAFSYEQLFTISNQLALPSFYRVLQEETDATVTAVFRASFVLVIACSAGFVAVFPHWLNVIVPSRFGNLTQLIAVLGIAVFWSGCYQVLVNVMFFHRRVGTLAITTGISSVVGVAPIFVLVGRMGVMAAAWATLAGYFAHFGLVALVVRRLIPHVPVAFPLAGGGGLVVLGLSQVLSLSANTSHAMFGIALAFITGMTIVEAARTDWSAVRRAIRFQVDRVPG